MIAISDQSDRTGYSNLRSKTPPKLAVLQTALLTTRVMARKLEELALGMLTCRATSSTPDLSFLLAQCSCYNLRR